jgi:VWFA-related protein
MQFRRISIRRAIINPAGILVFGGLLAYTVVRAQDDSKKPPTSSSQSQTTGQKDQKTEPVIRLETELVQIDLVVADKAGKLVSDLKREDFQVIEDGKPQTVTHFAMGSSSQPASWIVSEPRKTLDGKTAAPLEEVRGRYVVLAVDDFHLTAGDLLVVKQTLNKFIDKQLVSGDQVALATTSGNLGFYQQFTNEPDILKRAIKRLSVQERKVTSSFDVPRITDYQAELIDMGDSDALELAVQEILRNMGLPPSPPGRSNSASAASTRQIAVSQAQSKARMIVTQNAHYTGSTLETLEGVIRSLRDLPGRKMLVLLSDGFYLGGNIANKVYDLRRITDAATRAGVVIYSVDARGLIATPLGGDASEQPPPDVGMPGARARIENTATEAKRDPLNALARDTGGFPLFNTNDLNLGLQRVLDDNETYYVLAYEPQISHRDGRFHKIDVRIPGRPELRIRTRKGYFAPTETVATKQEKAKSPEQAEKIASAARETQLRAGLTSLFPLHGIDVGMSADFVDTPESGPVAVLNAELDAAGLTFNNVGGNLQSLLDVVAAVFDERGKVVASYNERVSINLTPARYEDALKQGFNYRKVVKLAPGFYQARIAIREDGTARVGSASQWVEVGDLAKKQLALSSVFLTPSLEADPVGTEAKAAREKNHASTSHRRFARGGAVDFFVVAYNARTDKGNPDLVVQSQVFSGSKLVYATPLGPVSVAPGSDQQRVPYAARLSLTNFSPGEYELRLVVIDRLAKATANKKVNFSVE